LRKLLILCGAALTALPAAQSQAQQSYSVKFGLDGFYRREWTRDIFGAPNEDRWRLQARPRLEIGVSSLLLGVGAELNHSEDKNVEPKPALLRDNYKSRDVRLDLAFASLKIGALQLQGGRFEMPLGVTEMIWDRDLRPQGAAATLEARDSAGRRRFAATALGARGSHVFEDEKTEMLALSAEAGLSDSLTLTGSYIRFRKIDDIEPMLRRQNRRAGGLFVNDYHVADVALRLRHEGQISTLLVADYCWNTAVDDENKGLWLGAVFGSLQNAAARLEYTYAKVDRDATLAAYASDDFFWATGWEGHRADVGVRLTRNTSMHAVGQLQRFKDSPRVDERDHWLKRYRLDLRVRY
jgi:hypothetical protein